MNTIGTSSPALSSVWRNKYRSAKMQSVLRNALVCEKICEVDRSNSYYIHHPYSGQPSANLVAMDGSYSVNAWTTTEDTLTVNNEVNYGEHIYDFESQLANFDLFATRTEEQAYAIATGIDKYVLNNLVTDATGTYTTPSGGFTVAANINTIFSELIGKVAGYSEMYKGMFIVLENTDVPGLVQAQATNGFNFSDLALNNGLIGNYMGVDIYIVRSGTYVTDTLAGEAVVGSGHRVFGIKGVSTYCMPGGLHFEEKGVTLKTGIEFVTYAYVGFKLWYQNTGLCVDITLA